jgi:outer membrane protein TolC
MFNLPLSTVIVPDTVVRLQLMVVDPVEGLAYARANRLDLKLAELSVDNRRANLRDAHKTSPITLALNGRIGFDGNSEGSAMQQSLNDALYNQERSTNISLRVSVPLFDRFNERHSVQRANNDLLSSEISLAERMRELENEVHLAAEEVANAVAQLALAENQYQITRQTLEIQTTRFSNNEIPSTEFLIDQANAREAEVDLLEAQVDVLLAQESWKRVIGVPPFENSGQAGRYPVPGRTSQPGGQPKSPIPAGQKR